MPHALVDDPIASSKMGRSDQVPNTGRKDKKRRHSADGDHPEPDRKRKRSSDVNRSSGGALETPDKPHRSKSKSRGESGPGLADAGEAQQSSPSRQDAVGTELDRASKKGKKKKKKRNDSYGEAALDATPSATNDADNPGPETGGSSRDPALQASRSARAGDQHARPKKSKRKETKHRAAASLDDVETDVLTSSRGGPDYALPSKPKRRKHRSVIDGGDGDYSAQNGTSKTPIKDAGQSRAEGNEMSPLLGSHPAPTRPEVLRDEPKRDGGKERKKRRHRAAKTGEDHGGVGPAAGDVPAPRSAALVPQPHDAPPAVEFPFFTQTTSLWLPLYPVGFDKPLESMVRQHLDPLVNHYSPVLGGVLLGYSDVALGDHPGRPKTRSSEPSPTVLASVDEYAVGFGWLTFTAQLFVPSRGAFMEGSLILQAEGHVGVVCWNKFNASIEAKRLPHGWRFVDLEHSAAAADEETLREAESHNTGEDAPGVQQMHATGYWVDAASRPVRGKLRFRIKNFDVGMAGDNGFISIEGTMLTEEEERELLAEELETERRRKLRAGGHLRREERRVPTFSLTRFGREDEEEGSGQRQELYKGSRPVTPDD